MAQVSVNIGALNSFLNNTVQPYLLKQAQEIAEEARRLAPEGATGDLKGNIRVERTFGSKGGVTVKADSPHAGFVHQGTGPGHIPNPRPNYFPGIRKRGLVIWSDSKGLNPYTVAKGIFVHGTPAKPFLEDAVQNVLGKFKFRWINKEIQQFR